MIKNSDQYQSEKQKSDLQSQHFDDFQTHIPASSSQQSPSWSPCWTKAHESEKNFVGQKAHESEKIVRVFQKHTNLRMFLAPLAVLL